MKKSTIWAITIIMALTFAGLLYVQVMYMKNILRMRDDQFAEGVKRSLYAVTGNLEQDETQYFLEEDVAQIETSVLPRYSSSSGEQGGIQYSFTTPEGKKGALTLQGDLNALDPTITLTPRQRQRPTHEILQEQYLKQRTLMNEVILRMISQSSTRPIAERADSGKVATYLRMELANNGLDLPFEFAVVNRQGAAVYHSAGYMPEQVGNDNMFVQTLFPNDTRNLMYYLKVYFPTKRDYIMSSLNYIIPAFIMTFVLLVVFVITIYLIFRQKKLTDMKNDFINNMTHEFKTPISTISLAAQMLNDSSVRKSSNMLEHISNVINDETKRLRFQVEKVLQMSMFERQKATLKLQDVDANTIVENIIHTFKIKVEKYGGHIEAVLKAEQSIIHVDEMHFTNVIFNLLDNAVKYRREDESLKLSVTTRDVSGGRLEVTVADNGIGIRREDLKKIFEKFYRVPTGNLHDVKGFGLGLAYVNKMVRELGGQITVESELGQGTRFIITLPLAKR
ncbi:sensor histidine kinase [Paramuribaculum intestinale]|uniref:histidine kinase n=2 Tax=Paramuribaculum intestinale TaxID=2094151 RepID=A0A2V1J3X0_9BACT|nr:HAMP domain-containing sensor histidine kinase [Paramuribaculum intestinale]ROS94113.1 sensor histidine kinase [Muribaculaceae bacterium Isolate-043 (Harlan)]RXE62067.1 HAMP domain-containing histidine kinase [Muribaculaceae bacterium Isolate-004 (NCI)]MCX4328969.1 HAMP domain-containing sensor histidine kinase [Paramuribaculum intestinale]PWB09750.1 sensor histidine kinase [Paramuribaculum intestinale]PWB10477.1 sensor histidine kinase [Paramuribaculum intestinale]